MSKKCLAIILAVCVFWIGIPVYAGSDNVTKDVWDMNGLQLYWESVEPDADGFLWYYSLNINPAEGKPVRFVLRYTADYRDEDGYNSGYRYFIADIPDGDFAFKNKAGDSLDFTATLNGLMESMDFHYEDGGDKEEKVEVMTDDGEDEWPEPEPILIEETKHFDLHAVIHDQTKIMGEQHTKTADTKSTLKIRGSSWPITVSGCIDDMVVQNIEGNLSTLTMASMTIGQVEPQPKPEPEPEPEPEMKSSALAISDKPSTSGKPDVMKNEIFQIYAVAGGMKDFEYYFSEDDYVIGTASYHWDFNIQLQGDVYMIIITYRFVGVPEIERTFTTQIPAAEIIIPSGFTGALTLDLELVGDVEEHQIIWHHVEIDGERFEEMEETFETFHDVPMSVHLVLDTSETGATKSIQKVKTVGFKGMQSGSTVGYSGVPSGTVNEENIGEGFYADISIGQTTYRTKGEMAG